MKSMLRRFMLAGLGLAALPAGAAAQATLASSSCQAGAVGFIAGSEQARMELEAAVAATGEGSGVREMVDLSPSAFARPANWEAMPSLLDEHYPRRLREEGRSGEVVLLARIDEAGKLAYLNVERGALDPEFTLAAVQIARKLAFRPTQHTGCAIPVWLFLPVRFNAQLAVARDSAGLAAPDPSSAACPAGMEAVAASPSASVRERDQMAATIAASGAGVGVRRWVEITNGADKPSLRNRSVVGRALEANYPPGAWQAGREGDVTLLMRIDETGVVSHASLVESSRLPEFENAALAVAQAMIFRPAKYGGCTVPVWVQLPIHFGRSH